MFKKICCFVFISSFAYLIRWHYLGRKCSCRKNLNGKIVIVTGATSGIGRALAKELAGKGATLILACRDIQKAENLRNEISENTGNPNIQVSQLDLSSLDSVSRFTENILANIDSVYALVNNAGLFYAKPRNTEDGFEETFQVNYLSPFLLTLQLLPALRKYEHPARVINVGSKSHLHAWLFPQPEYHREFEDCPEDRFRAYFYSKFCLTLFSWKLASLLENSNISVHCIDPGNTETAIFRTFPPLANKFSFWLQKPLRIFLVKTPREGAQSIVHTLLTEETPPFYLKNLQEFPGINSRIFDPILGITLWRMSRKMCGNRLRSATSELSRCLINVSSIEDLNNRESDILSPRDREEIWIDLGSAKTPLDCYIEIFLREMLTGEKSRCIVSTKSGETVSFTIKLLRIDFRGYLYELPAREMVNLSKKYKENGVAMFKKYPLFAHDYFSRAAKCLLSLGPLQKDNQHPPLEDVAPEELQELLENNYSNIAACLLKESRNEDVINVLNFTRRDHNVQEKALYRKAQAHFNLKQYEEAKTDLERLNYRDNREALALWNKNQAEWKKYDEKYAKMVQKMFIQ
ncbi:short-chain dehydrogenase TIC 32, chloroplastic [Sergentomyia squamirostris]